MPTSPKLQFTHSRAWGDAAAVVAGAAIPWAFAPFGLFPLAMLGPALLFAMWRHATPARAFWRGWLFGLAMFGIGVSWVHVSMHRFGGIGIPLSVALTGGFVAFLALFPALMGYLASRWWPSPRHRYGTILLLVLPALWVLMEWLKGLIFTGFPWLNLGYSQIDTPLRGFGPVLGVYGISWLTALSAGLLVYLFSARNRWRVALPALLFMWASGALLSQVDWTRTEGEPLKVSLVQGNVSQDVKWLKAQLEPTLRRYAELSRAHWDSDLVVWPETAIPAFYHQVKPYIQSLAQEARMNGSELLIGLPVFDKSQRRYYNAMMSVGLQEAFYFKQHLVPFGEYLPWQSVLGPFIDFFDIPMSDFSAGPSEPPLLTLAGRPAGLSICYEDAFGEEMVRALPQAAFLVNASNDAWFGDSMAPHQHLQIARMRSLETGRYMLRATNTGVSAVIDAGGRVQSRSPQFAVDVLTDEIEPRAGATPYVYLGNTALVLLLLSILAVVRYRGRRTE